MNHKPYVLGQGVVDNQATVDYTRLQGKSCIVTGGANGIGLQISRDLINAGAFVTIGDLIEESGSRVATGLGKNAQFVKCDVTSWEDQLALFKAAIANSPHKSCDIVYANAGIGTKDDLATFEESDEPVKPNLKTLEVNITGTAYTTKLAMHYFIRQPETQDRDRCLIYTASLAGYADQPGPVQYNASKFATRSLMRTYRHTCWQQGIRVNCISPWFIQTGIIGDATAAGLASKGVEFALVEDAALAALHLASDPNINGRSLGIVPRSTDPKGYIDLMQDDVTKDENLYNLQRLLL